MLETIDNFLNKTENGLYLIDMPTGTGKTYKAMEYIFNHFNEDRKFFYVTTLRKNVDDAIEELQKFFIKAEMLNEFESNVLRINSNADQVIEYMPTININSSDEIMRFNSFKELKRATDTIAKNPKIESLLKDKLLLEIRETLEPSFRRDVKAYLNSKCKNKREKKKLIDKSHKWLIDLYPSILTNYRKIYFLTVDKFYLGNDPIIEPAYKFIDNSLLMKNSLVFIDEIDATKNTILNREIEESLQNHVDFIHLFLNIHSTLNNKKFPKIILKPSKNDLEKGRTPADILIKMKNVFNEVFEAHNMQFSFKINAKDEDKKYIFDDNNLITISNNSKEKMFVQNSKEENYNKIISEEKDSFEPLYKVITDVNGALSYFINGCGMLAINYCTLYNDEKNDNQDIMQINDAISSIVRAFNVSERYVKYVCNLVLNKGIGKYKHNLCIETDVYDTGFRYFAFNDSMDNSLSTKISMYDLNNTPESFLLNAAEKTHIVGLSATSTMDTVIGNYDLLYLKDNLGSNFYKPSMDEEKNINEYINERLNSNKSNIIVKNINVTSNDDALAKIFKNKDYSEVILNIEEKFKSQENREFYFNRFLKVALVINDFVLSKLNSLLILCNRNLQVNDLYSKETFEKLLLFIKKDNNITEDYEIISLVSKNFEETRNEYLKALKTHKKVIIFSSYPTTGAGQNLQYEYDSDDGKIKEDLNAIYVEKPTNILVNTNNFNETTNADLIKYIFQVESLKTTGEISQKDKNICIREGFSRLYNRKSYKSHENLYKTNSVRNQAISVLIQAIGRICRTKNKKNDSKIYVDQDVFELDLDTVKSRRLNKEFLEIIKLSKSTHSDNFQLNKSGFLCNKQKAVNRNKDINTFINNLVSRRAWSPEHIKLWKDLREYVLKYPTKSEFDNEGRFAKCYLHMSEIPLNYYYYKEDNDYGDIDISTNKYNGFNKKVSSEDANLSILMGISFIKDVFISQGYAVDFDKNNNIMLPVIFNNIYKGALGEVVGKKIIELTQHSLEEIDDPEIFEKFDFRYKDIYFDFKNWNNKGEKLDIDHVVKKAKDVNAKLAFVINILGNEKEHFSKKDNVVVIPALIDIETKLISKKAYKYIKEVLDNA